MTWKEPTWKDGVLRIPVEGGRDVLVSFYEDWVPTIEQLDLRGDGHFATDWGDFAYRTVYRPKNPMQSGALTMIFNQA